MYRIEHDEIRLVQEVYYVNYSYNLVKQLSWNAVPSVLSSEFCYSSIYLILRIKVSLGKMNFSF